MATIYDKPRILIIGAGSQADVARAVNLVRDYIASGHTGRKSGRENRVTYAGVNNAYVWHTARQITASLGADES